MPTDAGTAPPVTLFLFAHQDDEFGVFHAIETCIGQGGRAVCAYFTRGRGELGPLRNAESTRVLGRLGVPPQDILFVGDALEIDDAALPLALDRLLPWLARWFASFERIVRIHVTAWEGGHHDHDALHAATLRVALQAGLLPLVRQYALYNRKGCPGPFFKVLTPLLENGPVETSRIPLGRRLAYLGLCLQYPSQRMTWVGLFPFVLLHYLFKGQQSLQVVNVARLDQRPHDGVLYYEYRKFFSWEGMRQALHAGQAPAP